MYTNNVQLIGNLVDAPEVQVLPQSGVVRARFRLASTERRRDPANETWTDGDSVFIDVTCWRRLAQHVGNSLLKGDRVVVVGRLRQWTAERDGVRRTHTEIEADVVAPDLGRAMVSVARPRRPEAADAVPAGAISAGAVPAGAGTGGPGVEVDPFTGEISNAGPADGGSAVEPFAGPLVDDATADGPLDVEFDARPLADAGV